MSSLSISASKYLFVFFGGLVLLLVVAVLSFALPPGRTPTANDQLWAATMRKEKNAAASKASGPRVLVYGGSDIFFGIDGAQLTQRTGYNSFNMGTHAGSGLGITLNDGMNFARAGDVVVFEIVPFQLFNRDAFITVQAKGIDQWIGRQYWKTGTLWEKLKLLSHATLGDLLTISESTPTIHRIGYWELALNQHGDIAPVASTPRSAARLERQIKPSKGTNPYAPAVTWSIPDLVSNYLWPRKPNSVDPRVGSLLLRTASFIEAKGASVFFMLSASMYPNTALANQALRDAVGERRLLVGASKLPKDLMYDTPFHVNAKGRKIVTQALGDALCAKIACL